MQNSGEHKCWRVLQARIGHSYGYHVTSWRKVAMRRTHEVAAYIRQVIIRNHVLRHAMKVMGKSASVIRHNALDEAMAASATFI